MIRLVTRMLAAAISLTLLGSCIDQLEPAPEPLPSPEAADLANKLNRAVNHYREQNDLPALKRIDGMDALALGHTRYLVKRRGTSYIHGRNVTHLGAEWRSIAANRRHQMDTYGENVAAITTRPEDLVEHLMLMWRTSFSHNKTMLGDWSHTGISLLIDQDGAVFVTQTFGRNSEK